MRARRPVPWISGGLATLVALWVAVRALPNTNTLVIDDARSPPHVYLQSHPATAGYILALAFILVLSIFILGRRGRIFEWLGWVVLVVLLLNVLQHG